MGAWGVAPARRDCRQRPDALRSMFAEAGAGGRAVIRPPYPEGEPRAPLCRCPAGVCYLHPSLSTCGMRERPAAEDLEDYSEFDDRAEDARPVDD